MSALANRRKVLRYRRARQPRGQRSSVPSPRTPPTAATSRRRTSSTAIAIRPAALHSGDVQPAIGLVPNRLSCRTAAPSRTGGRGTDVLRAKPGAS